MQAELKDAVDPRDLGARLRGSRQARGWTQAKAARELGVARTTVTAMEKGERRVKPEELLLLSRLYGRKLSELVRPGAPAEDVAADFSVLLRSSLPSEPSESADLSAQIHELERLCEDYSELERLSGAGSPRRDPPSYSLEGAEPEEVAEDVATAERNRLGLGEAPVHNLREILGEDVGLKIFFLELPASVAGMFAFTERHGAAVAVNRKHPPERRRHSMAHEYGHFLTDRYRPEITLPDRYTRRPAVERFAETFGRAFLMPAASLRRRFHEALRQGKREGRSGATPADLCRLAHYYFVSFEAMARRLEELGLIAAGTWEKLRQQGFGVREAEKLLGLPERPVDDELLPARYRFLAVEAWQRGELSEGQLASFLRVDRLTARQTVQQIRLDRGADGETSFDLFLPLAAGHA